MLLPILIIITCICISGFLISMYNDNDNAKAGFITFILLIGFLGWG